MPADRGWLGAGEEAAECFEIKAEALDPISVYFMKTLVDHILGERVQTVVLRAIPKEQAKKEILDLYKQSHTALFYSDVAEKLSLDLELVLELCTELENEGRIGVLNR